MNLQALRGVFRTHILPYSPRLPISRTIRDRTDSSDASCAIASCTAPLLFEETAFELLLFLFLFDPETAN
jgi:hypothetical protein